MRPCLTQRHCQTVPEGVYYLLCRFFFVNNYRRPWLLLYYVPNLNAAFLVGRHILLRIIHSLVNIGRWKYFTYACFAYHNKTDYVKYFCDVYCEKQTHTCVSVEIKKLNKHLLLIAFLAGILLCSRFSTYTNNLQ